MEQSFIEYSLGKDASSAVLWVYPVRKPRGKAIIKPRSKITSFMI